jgi:acetyl esterase/lipase
VLLATYGAAMSGVATTGAEPATDIPAAAVTAEITVHRLDYPTRGSHDPTQNWGDLYLPAGPQGVDTIPLVVLVHGGSWKSRLGAGTMTAYARALARRGLAVYNIEYRRVGSGGGWPTTFTDVADALDFVVDIDRRFPQLKVDNQLVVGHSAGAQLAVWAGTRNPAHPNAIGGPPTFRPAAVVSLSGPLDMVYGVTRGNDRIVTVLGGTPGQVPARYRAVDPIQNIDADVPVVAVHGDRDPLVSVPNSQRYIDQLTRRGGQGRLVIAAGETHGSFLIPNSPAYERILQLIVDAAFHPPAKPATAH